MPQAPHRDKLRAALSNQKCGKEDITVLQEALTRYEQWASAVSQVRSIGKERVFDLTRLLNGYKDFLEVELIAKSQSPFLMRQKGQLKLDNSVIEEFLIQLIDRRILDGLPEFDLDKTMFQEAAGTAARLKQGCPMSRYYLLVEYLDMEPEDCRLTAIDNVFLIRHAKRLPFDRRNKYDEVKQQHERYPIDPDVIWRFCQEIQSFVKAVWYEPTKALARGSFV